MRKIALAVVAAAAAFAVAKPAEAQFIPLLTFENNELAPDPEAQTPFGGANSATGLDGAGYGVTEGTQAFVINDAVANTENYFVTTLSGSDSGEALANYNAFLAAYNEIVAGKDVFVTFDFGYDVTGVTNTAFFQPGIHVNSDQGFSDRRFGALLQGNLGPGGDFPRLNATAAAGGATLTILDPINAANGDPRGLIRVAIPLGTAGDPELLNIGPGGDTTNNFFQIALHQQGGFTGTADFSFDRVGFEVVPEPASLGLLGTAGLSLLARRRRRSV